MPMTALISSELVEEMLELDLMINEALADNQITPAEHREIRRQLKLVRTQADDVDRGIRGAMSYLRSARLNPSVRARHNVRDLPTGDDLDAA